MLDWFLSKLGILVFIVVVAGVLLLFSSSQLSILSQAVKVQAVNSLSRTIDSLCEGCSINYTFDKVYNIDLKEKNITMDGVLRRFSSSAGPASFSSDKITVYRKTGVVYAKKI